MFPIALAAALVLGGCAHTPFMAQARDPAMASCARGERPARVAHLFFGRNDEAAPQVSEADFARFLDHEVVRRFKGGLSVIDIAEVHRGKDGVVSHALGKAVLIVLTDRPGEDKRVEAVRAAYKAEFSQESRLTATDTTCIAS